MGALEYITALRSLTIAARSIRLNQAATVREQRERVVPVFMSI